MLTAVVVAEVVGGGGRVDYMEYRKTSIRAVSVVLQRGGVGRGCRDSGEGD